MIPGKIMEELENNNRIVGGLTDKASTLVRDFYATLLKINRSNKYKTAEMVKLAENFLEMLISHSLMRFHFYAII